MAGRKEHEMPFTKDTHDTWTGLTGEADQIVRNTGHKFWVFEAGPTELVVASDIITANNLLDSDDFIAFIVMYAMDEEKAKELFYDAQDQWRAWLGGVEDFLGVVNVTEHLRLEDGPTRRNDEYETWAKEMETRYGIVC